MASYKELIEYCNQNNNFCKFLGVQITELEQGYAKGEMKIKEQLLNIYHTVHGGSIFSLADTIGGLAALSYGNSVVTMSSDFHYLSAAAGIDKIYATAREIKHGKKISVYDVEIRDDGGRLVAKGTFSYFDLEKPILL